MNGKRSADCMMDSGSMPLLRRGRSTKGAATICYIQSAEFLYRAGSEEMPRSIDQACAYCLLPTAYCLLPTAYCLLPTRA